MPTPALLRRVFMGWDRPVLEVAVDWLCGEWSCGPLVLDDALVIVPTAQSARRLREALAVRAASAGTAVFAPRVVTPETLLSPAPREPPVASALESLAAWTRVLQDTDPETLPDLFPPAVSRGPRLLDWVLGVARRLVDLRAILGERGLTIAEAAEQLRETLGTSEPWEPARWEQLCELESRFLEVLAKAGVRDANQARRDAAGRATVPAAVRRVVLVALPDPLPLLLDWLGRLAESLPVTVLVHAPAERAAEFDEWGRPGPLWQDPTCLLPITDADLHLVARPQDQARLAVDLLTRDLPGQTALGVVDADLMPHLELRLREAGIAAFDPAGLPLHRSPVFELLSALCDLAETDRFETAARLFRHPDVQASLRRRSIVTDVPLLLTRLDELQNQHLPHSFAAAAGWAGAGAAAGTAGAAELAAACAWMQDLVAPWRGADAGAEALLAVLQGVYADHRLDAHRPEDRLFESVASTITETLLALDAPLVRAAGLSGMNRLRLALGTLASQRVYPENPEGLELDGWLELHWNDAPRLVVTGFNEGRVPQSMVGHVFLPDAARRRLGLLHNDRRLARDAYLLAAMAGSRPAAGALQVILGKVSGDGDVLKPSRLLFRCADDVLPSRALRLFREVEPDASSTPWQRAWTLSPPRLPPPDHLAVTAFRDYLACPFRFYLKRVVGMERLDDRKSELDAMDFGTLCHAALEDFAADLRRRESTDPREIEAFLTDRATASARARFGTDLPAAVTVQLDAACQRLRAAARIQAEQRAQGWRIVGGEHRLGGGRGVLFHGLPVRGTVDRIDRHDGTGVLRLLDYKTSEKAVGPAQQHLAGIPRDEAEAEDVLSARCDVAGRPKRWVDLQLPLYMILLRETVGPIAQCAYFALPKAVTETAVLAWDDLPAELLSSAERCAAACVDAIRAGRFWPPTEKLVFDDFAELFHGSVADSIDPACVPFLQGRGDSCETRRLSGACAPVELRPPGQRVSCPP